jgi:CHAT domain-containing protein/Tfp pilus assembly protein PilF
MVSRHRRFRMRRVVVILFLSSFTFCLALNHLPFAAFQRIGGNAAIAHSTPPHSSNSATQLSSRPPEGVLSSTSSPRPPITPSPQTPRQLVQQGIEQYQAGELREAIASWQTALSAYQRDNNLPNQTLVREKLAIAYQQIGDFEEAIAHWQEAIANSRHQGDLIKVGRLLTELAQTYSRLGQNRQAIALLCGTSETDGTCLESEGSALQIARKLGDRATEAAALGSLGEAYRLRGKYDEALETLEASLKIIQEINLPAYHSSVLNSLGNTYLSQAQLNEERANSAQFRGAEHKKTEFIQAANSNYQKASNYFNNSLELSRAQNNPSGQMQALLNLIQLDNHPIEVKSTHNSNPTNSPFQDALTLLERLPDSANKVYAAIDLAKLEQSVSANFSTLFPPQCPPRQLNETQAETLLKTAIAIAQRLQDSRSESFALGQLGHLYECRQDYNQALEFTQKARWTADQNLRSQDSLYLWEWQAGRIFKAQRKPSEASQAYERAIATLEGEGGLRNNLLMAERDLQFSFRDTISPLYREFARLKLEQAESLSPASPESQKELDFALDTVDSLKLAELQNYFGNDCILTVFNKERIDDLEKEDTAVFSSIVWEDRTAIVLSLPNPQYQTNPNAPKRLKKFQWLDDSQTLKEEIKTFRREIQKYYDFTYSFLTPAQNLYNRMIRPFISDLDPTKIKTLVFIQDGLLRSIPMAALHDGQHFLVENYAIATTPGLRLTSPQPLKLSNLRTLGLGLTEAATVEGETFKPLENVAAEIERVIQLFPDSKKLLNDQFTRNSFEQELKQAIYPVIHIATHGQFGTIPEDTFLVTGKNEKITITQLESDIRRFSGGPDPLELLALTACQTGIGDDRATLGMAGITVQAGVRSALASLWYVDDAITQELVVQFYNNLRSPMSKAQALQEAQKALIHGDKKVHPARWAPFILIGNWL